MEENPNFQLLDNKNKVEIKAYKQRWIILAIFMLNYFVNAYQWIEYAIISNIVTKYYNVTSIAVDWTSTIYVVLYIALVIPALYILDRWGLRVAALWGSLGTALGTGIKVFSVNPDRFWLVLLGQAICSISQIMILCLPPRIASVWFKANELSTACSLGVFASKFGVALGFLVTPIIVKNRENIEEIGQDLQILCWCLTAVAIVPAIAVIFYFPKQPLKPPNLTQLQILNQTEKFSTKAFFNSLFVLMKNFSFLTHCVSFGINFGVYTFISVFLNQLIIKQFTTDHDVDKFAGQVGLVLTSFGIVGVIIFGIFLDKTHKYKETCIFIYFSEIISFVVFIISLNIKSKLLIYGTSAALGLFLNVCWAVSCEFAIELTYPSAEGTVTGLLLTSGMVVAAALLIIFGKLLPYLGLFCSLWIQIVLLVIGVLITCFIPNKLKRQAALKS